LPEQDNVAQIDVYWQDEVTLDLDASLMYIVSGKQEIQDYVDNKSKPEIDEYIQDYAKPIVSEVVDQIATPVIDEYFENTVKPSITEFAEEEMAGYAATATEQAGIAAEKANEASETAKIVDEKVQEFGQTTEASKTEFVNFAQEKTEEFEQTAITATEQATVSAERSRIWAEGEQAGVKELGGELSSKGWALQASNSANNAQASATRSENAAARADEAITITNANVVKIDNIVENAAEELSKNLNNPFSLLDYKWSEYEITNASWLLSNGAFHSGTVYKSVYELLLKVYNGTETKDGVSVKLATEEYSDTDFVLNTSDMTFRLPIKVSNTPVSGLVPIVGTTNVASWATAQANLVGKELFVSIATSQNSYTRMIATDGSGELANTATIGMSADLDKAANTSLKLYFYVGETVQDANVIVASNALTDIAKKTDSVQAASASMPSDRYIDLTLGASGSTYTAPANGWFYLSKVVGGDWYYVELDVVKDGETLFAIFADAYRTSPGTIIIPVKKGDTVVARYNATGATSRFRFIYAEGE
jgi:hypothetical protein